MPPLRSLAALVVVALGAGSCYLACSAPPPPAVPPATSVVPPVPPSTAAATPLAHVQILAINDFHGNLEPPSGTNGVVLVAPDDPLAATPDARTTDAGVTLIPAGGAAYLATHVAQLRSSNPATIVVSAGDLTGASPMVSNLYEDQPVILVMNRIGLDLEAVGNHDFDRGLTALRLLQQAGCASSGCDGGAYPGASFQYLAANVVDDVTGRTVFSPYAIRDLGGARVAFIGETLVQTPSVSKVGAVKGLSFEDEAATANALVPELQRQGVSAIVLLLHQGGMQSLGGTYDGCQGFSGDIGAILQKL
ncbi:MAG TPA: hypothetical protein VHS09_04535, partial [Polyangiaceae bacterium]|nr:hypothetical protein [Polyangiaceae bacterium]